MKKSGLLLALLFSLLSFMHPTAFQNYVSFRGSRQGAFKGESTQSGRQSKGLFEVKAFDLGGEALIDASRTVAAGKRPHKLFTLTKNVDGATPKLLVAHQTNEVLITVIIQTMNEQDQVSKTLTLNNALISDIKTSGDTETLTFSYDSMVQH